MPRGLFLRQSTGFILNSYGLRFQFSEWRMSYWLLYNLRSVFFRENLCPVVQPTGFSVIGHSPPADPISTFCHWLNWLLNELIRTRLNSAVDRYLWHLYSQFVLFHWQMCMPCLMLLFSYLVPVSSLWSSALPWLLSPVSPWSKSASLCMFQVRLVLA